MFSLNPSNLNHPSSSFNAGMNFDKLSPTPSASYVDTSANFVCQAFSSIPMHILYKYSTVLFRKYNLVAFFDSIDVFPPSGWTIPKLVAHIEQLDCFPAYFDFIQNLLQQEYSELAGASLQMSRNNNTYSGGATTTFQQHLRPTAKNVPVVIEKKPKFQPSNYADIIDNAAKNSFNFNNSGNASNANNNNTNANADASATSDRNNSSNITYPTSPAKWSFGDRIKQMLWLNSGEEKVNSSEQKEQDTELKQQEEQEVDTFVQEQDEKKQKNQCLSASYNTDLLALKPNGFEKRSKNSDRLFEEAKRLNGHVFESDSTSCCWFVTEPKGGVIRPCANTRGVQQLPDTDSYVCAIHKKKLLPLLTIQKTQSVHSKEQKHIEQVLPSLYPKVGKREDCSSSDAEDSSDNDSDSNSAYDDDDDSDNNNNNDNNNHNNTIMKKLRSTASMLGGKLFASNNNSSSGKCIWFVRKPDSTIVHQCGNRACSSGNPYGLCHIHQKFLA
jgi:hypothetical protein